MYHLDIMWTLAGKRKWMMVKKSCCYFQKYYLNNVDGCGKHSSYKTCSETCPTKKKIIFWKSVPFEIPYLQSVKALFIYSYNLIELIIYFFLGGGEALRLQDIKVKMHVHKEKVLSNLSNLTHFRQIQVLYEFHVWDNQSSTLNEKLLFKTLD